MTDDSSIVLPKTRLDRVGLGMAVLVCLPFLAAPVSADEVCDYLRKKIVWNYAIGSLAPHQRVDKESAIDPKISVIPGNATERFWLELYLGSDCSSRKLAEDLLRADVIAENTVDQPLSNRTTVFD